MKIKTWHATKTNLIDKWWLKVTYNHSGSLWGRCGGGWSFIFSVQGSPSCILFQLTLFTIRIAWKNYEHPKTNASSDGK